MFYPGGRNSNKNSPGNIGDTLHKAKKRMEDKLNKIGIKKGKKKDKSMDSVPGSCKNAFCAKSEFIY